ncbi:GerMN domain-containing protein [Nostoc sp. FACHB-87]|uniref:GerMN domain-containing protein n=1 Tax=Nostocaceae TaxID=1162 RepID=UPI001681E779|nr:MULTISPECIES: GerMN domain-containing protein [Nostocaceae]MBD2455466.1 GerMN domain-containing protein [Nostoc sp. FACHB-87]MBD2475866.1 GerMN domain-containing protein [Anabaena sp. FACHB-83]
MKTQRNYLAYRGEAIAASALVILALFGGTTWWSRQITNPTTQANNSAVIIASKSAPAVAAIQPQTYWLKFDNNQIHLVPQPVEVKAGLTSEAALKLAFTHLLTTPKTADLSTTIPPGTKLLDLRVTQAGIYLNLSSEFSQGGGSTSMAYRLAQVVYTATSIDPTAKVFVSVAGKPIDIDHPLGGEGLILRQPITRRQFAEDFTIS